eukprot:GGOE01001883.1.p2 GENE.GGOE01001883.1~~GGOE01001883.1.p2  ORF type:complete len:147 (-),score=23.76 GGOE01001883.1:270-710(-)
MTSLSPPPLQKRSATMSPVYQPLVVPSRPPRVGTFNSYHRRHTPIPSDVPQSVSPQHMYPTASSCQPPPRPGSPLSGVTECLSSTLSPSIQSFSSWINRPPSQPIRMTSGSFDSPHSLKNRPPVSSIPEGLETVTIQLLAQSPNCP